MPETIQKPTSVIEPYKLCANFAISPEYDGNSIFLNTFISTCKFCLQYGFYDTQQALVVLHINNKLRGKAAELVNSRNRTQWDKMKTLLDNHFGDEIYPR